MVGISMILHYAIMVLFLAWIVRGKHSHRVSLRNDNEEVFQGCSNRSFRRHQIWSPHQIWQLWRRSPTRLVTSKMAAPRSSEHLRCALLVPIQGRYILMLHICNHGDILAWIVRGKHSHRVSLRNDNEEVFQRCSNPVISGHQDLVCSPDVTLLKVTWCCRLAIWEWQLALLTPDHQIQDLWSGSSSCYTPTREVVPIEYLIVTIVTTSPPVPSSVEWWWCIPTKRREDTSL